MTSLSTSDTYTYDANGNTLAPGAHLPRAQVPGTAGVTCRVENGITYKQEYNYDNLLMTVKKMNGTCSSGTVLETTSFVYDGDGNLVKKTLPDGNKTLYPSTMPQKAAASLRAGSGGPYEVDKTPGGAVKRTVTYYPAAGATPALQRTQCGASVRINTVGGSNSVYYILKDHLCSASVVTDSTGAVVSGSEQRHYPYGESRLTGTMLTDKLFTGQRDVGLGIYH